MSISAINPKDTNNVEVTVKTTGADKVELTLVGAGADETVEVKTNGTATYTFEDLPSGSYVVEAVAKAGEEATAIVRSTEVVITPADAEQMTGIAGFVRDNNKGVAGVEVELGNRKTTTDYNGYFELELAPGIHDITFRSGAGVHIAEGVVIVEGRTTGLVVAENALGIPSIDKNTITATVMDHKGELATGKKIVLQAKVDGKWLDIKEDDNASGNTIFKAADVAGTGFPHDTEYRFELMDGDKGVGLYSNEVNFKPNPAKNIDLVLNLKEIDTRDVEEMNLTVNLKDNKGDDVTAAPGTLSLHSFDKVEGVWEEFTTKGNAGDKTVTFKEALLTGEEVIVKYTPDVSGANVAEEKAKATIGDLLVEAKIAGAAGNAITVALVDPSQNDAPLGVVVADKAITVNLATDNNGDITSTVADIVTAINNNTDANDLVIASGAGTTAVNTAGPTNLAGGVDAAYADNFAVTTQKVKIAKEGKDQTISMRLVGKELANQATVNFKTADKKNFANNNYDVTVYDNNGFPIVDSTEGSLTLDSDKTKATYTTTQLLPYGNYTVEIANDATDTAKGSMIIGEEQEYKLQISKTSAVIKEALVNLGVEVKLTDDAKSSVYDSDTTATTTGRVIYADVINKDGKVIATERFVSTSSTETEEVVLAAGKDYTVVTRGFRLTEQEIDTKFDVKREADGTGTPTDATNLPDTKNVEDGAIVSGKVTRNGVLVNGASVTAYLGGRKLDSKLTTNGVYTGLTLPHAGEYTIVVRGTDVATSEFKLDAKAGATIKDLELKVKPVQDGDFTVITDGEIAEIEVLDQYTAALGERGFAETEGKITTGITIAGKTVKVEDLTTGEYLVRITPESKDLDPILTTINIGREGAKVTRRIDFPSALNKRTVEVNFLNSKDGSKESVTGTLVAINTNGDVVEVETINNGNTATLELQDGNYTLKFVDSTTQAIYVGVASVEVDGVSVTVDMEIVDK